MPQSSGAERAHRFHGNWLSHARMWSASTRRLINSPDAGENYLTVVSLYLRVHSASLLITNGYGITADEVMRKDCGLSNGCATTAHEGHGAWPRRN